MKDRPGAIRARYPNGNVRVEKDVVHAMLDIGDGWFPVRVRTTPVAEVFVALRALDGFALELRWGDRFRDPDVGDEAFDDAFGIVTNDVDLMRLWLDETARKALLASTYELLQHDVLQEMTVTKHRRAWTYELRGLELVATKGAVELDPERFLVAIETACVVAGRSYRWAAEYAALARTLDGYASSPVELGGGPVLTATRRAIEVEMRVLRKRDGGARLRTVMTARRVGRSGETASLVATDAPKGAVPEVRRGERVTCAIPGYALRRSSNVPLDGMTEKLVAAARPLALVVEDTGVELWFDGAPMERERLDAGIELVVRWAVDGIETSGPYR